MDEFIERRRHPRVRVKVRIEVLDPASGRGLTLYTTDLCAGGAHCTGLTGIPRGSALDGQVFLPLSEGGRDVDVPVTFRGSVLRTSESGAVVCFDEMRDADRDEIRRFLFDWMADDCVTHASMAEAV